MKNNKLKAYGAAKGVKWARIVEEINAYHGREVVTLPKIYREVSFAALSWKTMLLVAEALRVNVWDILPDYWEYPAYSFTRRRLLQVLPPEELHAQKERAIQNGYVAETV